MATFNQEQAVKQYSLVMQAIHAGAYQEKDVDGSYGEDGIEKSADDLMYQAAQHGLEFHWHEQEHRYTLEPLSAESKAAFLHVNVENLVSILAETARYLVSIPYESELDKSYRTGLHERIGQVIQQSYRVPVLREESDQEYQDTQHYIEHFYEGGE